MKVESFGLVRTINSRGDMRGDTITIGVRTFDSMVVFDINGVDQRELEPGQAVEMARAMLRCAGSGAKHSPANSKPPAAAPFDWERFRAEVACQLFVRYRADLGENNSPQADAGAAAINAQELVSALQRLPR